MTQIFLLLIAMVIGIVADRLMTGQNWKFQWEPFAAMTGIVGLPAVGLVLLVLHFAGKL